eukprot:g11290.t1
MAWVNAFERRPLRQLLDQHREAIDAMRQELGDSPFDDTSLLRYALSYGQRPHEAVEAARKALAWRQEHRGLVEAARERKAPPGLSTSELCTLQTLLLTAFHGTTAFGDPIFVIRAGGIRVQQTGIMESSPVEEMKPESSSEPLLDI